MCLTISALRETERFTIYLALDLANLAKGIIFLQQKMHLNKQVCYSR